MANRLSPLPIAAATLASSVVSAQFSAIDLPVASLVLWATAIVVLAVRIGLSEPQSR